MAIPVILPRQGQSVESCIFSTWHVPKGSQIKKGDLLYTYETDKAAFDAESPEDGTLLETFVNPGDAVPVLDTIGIIGKPGENFDHLIPSGSAKEKPSEMPGQPVEQTNSLIPEAKTPLAGSGHPKISPRAKKTAGQFKINLSSLTGSGPEGRIIERDVIQKAGNQPKSTPLAKVMAFEKGVDLPPAGSGPGGKVLSTDLKLKSSVPDFQDFPLSNIRKIIARNMKASLQNTAQLTLHSSADASGLLDTRKKIKSLPESSEWKGITINDLVCFAVTRALIAHPEMNAHFLENSIRRFSVVHLGVAVDSNRGLMVPTLHSADRLDILNLSKKIKDLSQKSQSGSIDPELLSGATFTVTNLGAFGIESFTPVLNPPQIGILGINNIRYFPGESAEGIFGFIPRIGLSLTFDHRAIDGAPASRFLQKVIKEIENLKSNISYA